MIRCVQIPFRKICQGVKSGAFGPEDFMSSTTKDSISGGMGTVQFSDQNDGVFLKRAINQEGNKNILNELDVLMLLKNRKFLKGKIPEVLDAGVVEELEDIKGYFAKIDEDHDVEVNHDSMYDVGDLTSYLDPEEDEVSLEFWKENNKEEGDYYSGISEELDWLDGQRARVQSKHEERIRWMEKASGRYQKAIKRLEAASEEEQGKKQNKIKEEDVELVSMYLSYESGLDGDQMEKAVTILGNLGASARMALPALEELLTFKAEWEEFNTGGHDSRLKKENREIRFEKHAEHISAVEKEIKSAIEKIERDPAMLILGKVEMWSEEYSSQMADKISDELGLRGQFPISVDYTRKDSIERKVAFYKEYRHARYYTDLGFVRVGYLIVMGKDTYEKISDETRKELGSNVVLVNNFKETTLGEPEWFSPENNTFKNSTLATMLSLMEQDFAGRNVLDAGAGDGLLSVLSLKLGSSKTILVDNDSKQLNKAKDMLTLNGYKEQNDFILIKENLKNSSSVLNRIPKGIENIFLISNIGENWEDYGGVGNDTSIDLIPLLQEQKVEITGVALGGYVSIDVSDQDRHAWMFNGGKKEWEDSPRHSSEENIIKLQELGLIEDIEWDDVPKVIVGNGTTSLLFDLGMVEVNQDKDEGGDSSVFGKKKGGIDFNPELMEMEEWGQDIEFDIPAEWRGVEPADIEGFVPVIINVAPITNLPLLLGFNPESEPSSQPLADQDPLFEPMAYLPRIKASLLRGRPKNRLN